jgi:hypothetical protein
MVNMNTYEARLAVHKHLVNEFLGLLTDDEKGDGEGEVLDDFRALADTVIQALGIEVTEVNDDGSMTAKLVLTTGY